jgi:hypothetical protein
MIKTNKKMNFVVICNHFIINLKTEPNRYQMHKRIKEKYKNQFNLFYIPKFFNFNNLLIKIKKGYPE